MAANTRTPIEIEHHRTEIARRYLRGDYQADIARDLGLTPQMVNYDLKVIRAAWLASSIRDFDAARAQELVKVDEVEREYWAAWERSKLDKEIAVQKGDGAGKPKEVSLRKEGQAGNPAFLAGVLSCIERRCQILGLDAPKRFIVDWDKLTDDEWDKLAAGVPPEKAAPGKVLTA